MTISSTDDPRAGPFNGNGSQTAFPFEFKVFSDGDLFVVRADAAGVEYPLVLDSDYSVALNTDQDANPGGTVAYPLAGATLPVGETLTIEGALALTQPTDITNGGGFYPQVIENALDRCVMLVKQVNSAARRALKLAVSTPDGVDVTLPVPVANQVIGWDVSGESLANYPADTSVSSAILESRLADRTASANGAGMSGYGANTPYATRTVGGRLRDIGVFASDIPGYDPTGVADSTAAINVAISIAVARGLYTVYITGTPRVSGSNPFPFVTKLAFVGVGAGGFFTNNPDTFPVRMLCNGVNGYLFDQPDVEDGSGALLLKNICFDGRAANGAYSSTWQGVVKNSVTPDRHSFYLRIKSCMATCSNSATAILDLNGQVFALVEDSFFSNWPYGMGHKGGDGVLTTTITFRKTYWNSCRQVGEWSGKATDITYDCPVMESCVVGVAVLKGNVTVRSLYSENMGYDSSGTGITTGLTPRAMGIADTPEIAGNVSAVFTTRYGQIHFEDPTLQATTGGKKWFEVIGRESAQGAGGAIFINGIYFAAGVINNLFAADTDTDTPSSKANGEYHLTARPGNLYITAADARMITKGRVPLLWSDGGSRIIEVENGLFTIPALPAGGLTSRPTIAPSGGDNVIGDRVRMSGPLIQGIRNSYVCAVGGNAAASRWQIDGFVPSSKTALVANGATMQVTATERDSPGELHVWEVTAATAGSMESLYRLSIQAFDTFPGVLYVQGQITTRTLNFTLTWGDPYTITITNTSGASMNVYARLVSVSGTHA